MKNSEMMPFFSICIPAYNAGQYLSETIESVLAQSYTDFEIVIVNNASTDDTASLVSRFQDRRIRVFTNSITVPAHENWTLVVGLARGEWVKLLCADDLLKPDALQQIHDDLSIHPEVSVHSGIRDVIDETGRLVKSAKPFYRNGAFLNQDDVIKGILRSGTNPLGEPLCITWKNDLTKQVGPFSNIWKYFIDLDYWLRLSKVSPIYYSSGVLGSFRVSSDSWTSSIGLRTNREARKFIFSRDDFASCSRFVKYRAVTHAGLRTIARQLFLSLVLRKNH